MVSSPTGSGKTLVGEMGLLRAVTAGQKALYIVPLRALASQVADVLKERYEPKKIKIGISTGDYESEGSDLSEFDILVTTYERTDSLLRHKVDWLSELGTVVIDEIQNLSTIGRGARLESVIIRLRRLVEDLQIIALSATVGMPDQLADWLGCFLVESNERPVPLLCSVSQSSDKNESVRKYTMTTVQRDGQVLIFHRTRKETEAQALRLSTHVSKQLTSKEQATIDAELNSVEHYHVGIPRNLRQLLHEGVAFHHAGLSSSARGFVELLFRNGLVRVLCATTTLASGMDLPARTVVVTNCRAPLNHNELIQANRVHQMLGRAGRPGKDKKGFGVIIADSFGQAEEIRRRYFHETSDDATGNIILEPKYEPVTSRFGNTQSLQEQLLVALDMLGSATVEEIEDALFTESYLMHQGVRNSGAPMRLYQLDDITAESSIEKYALADTVRAARHGVLGTVKIREISETVIGGIVTEQMGPTSTCRFSTRTTKSGSIEGPMCSCGKPIDKNRILCPHLVALGLVATKERKDVADFVIPIALNETSPERMLVRLGLIEGATDRKLKPTSLGRVVNRLYLRIATVRELLAMIPFIQDNTGLLSLLRHLTNIESNQMLDESFEHVIALTVSTNQTIEEIANQTGLSEGDLYTLLDRVRWLAFSLMVIAENGKLIELAERTKKFWEEIDSKFTRRN